MDLYQTPLPLVFDKKISGLSEDIYPLAEHHRLTRLLKALLEDSGVGMLFQVGLIARLSETIEGTSFSELDAFFGSVMRMPRLNDESYTYDPYSDWLSPDELREIERKDSQYRERLRGFLKSMSLGGTIWGLEQAAEASCGVPCVITERWRYEDDMVPVDPGRTQDRRELIVSPYYEIGENQRLAIYRTLERLKPADASITVLSVGTYSRTEVPIAAAASPSEFYTMEKTITLDEEWNGYPSGTILDANTRPYLGTQEQRWQLNGIMRSVKAYAVTEDGEQVMYNDRLSEPSWSPWMPVELADSPDNYPNGKFPDSPDRVGEDGIYSFSWDSQESYVSWLKNSVLRLEGEFRGDRYRIPLFGSSQYTDSSPVDALAPMRYDIISDYFGE